MKNKIFPPWMHIMYTYYFLFSKWKVSSGEKFDYYMDFVKKIANATYENLDNMAPYVNNTNLKNIDIMDLILKVSTKLIIYKLTLQN